MDDQDQRPMMADDAKRRDATEDDRDKNLEHDDSMFHTEQVPGLAEDGARPAEPAHDVPGAHVPLDHPETDSNVDSMEAYDEGIGNASGVNTSHEDSDTIERVVED